MLDPARDPESISLPDAPPVLPVQRLGAVLEVLLCSGFPSQLVLITFLTGLGMHMRRADGHLLPGFIFTLSLLDAALVVGLVFFFFRSHRERPRDILLGERRVWHEVGVGVALVPIVFLLVVVVLLAVQIVAPHLHNVLRNPLEDMLQNRQDTLVFLAVVMIAGGVREEIQRGFILHRFDQYLGGGGFGVVCYSILFGLGHKEQGLDAALATGLLGALWGIVYIKRRSVVAPMVSHTGFNLAQLLKYMALR